MVWRIDDPQGNEAGKVKFDIVRYTRGVVLDLGCGPYKAFPHFVGVDNCIDTKLFGTAIKPDVEVADCSDLSSFKDDSCDAVFSSHLLEHIEDTVAALKEWWRVLKVGGYLVLYLPHRDLYPNCGQPGANPDHKHDFISADILDAMSAVSSSHEIVVDEVRAGGMEYSFLLVLRKTDDGSVVRRDTRPSKTACVVRYGGFGDMIQASNLLPELKRQGYHVTMMTTPKGQEILSEDPHIDEWFIQDTDQVPNKDLPAFWAAQAKHYDKFVQLSESVEGTLLAMPGRYNHSWPLSVRQVELNKNYLEWTSQLAELDYHSEARFYETPAERAKVQAYLAQIRSGLAPADLPPMVITPPRFYILWVLAGSSVHKFYPHQDTVIARILLKIPEAVVIFSGDYACQILEQGWENEPRVRCESGNMPIRATLALAKAVDCVVGPETGVLNAVAFEKVDKVLLLSHSSRENLSKHWINTATMEPVDTPCFPCHQLHYSSDFCPLDPEMGGAMCAMNIDPMRVYEEIYASYRRWRGT